MYEGKKIRIREQLNKDKGKGGSKTERRKETGERGRKIITSKKIRVSSGTTEEIREIGPNDGAQIQTELLRWEISQH